MQDGYVSTEDATGKQIADLYNNRYGWNVRLANAFKCVHLNFEGHSWAEACPATSQVRSVFVSACKAEIALPLR